MPCIFGEGLKVTSDEFHEIHGFLRVHKDGRCERFLGTGTVPAGTDELTGVRSKDVVISPETNLSARLYIPTTTAPDEKLPVVIYFHGGGFVIESTTSPAFHPSLNLLTADTNVITVSVDYRLAPEYLMPIPYEDAWEAIKWVAAHHKGGGPDSWLNDHADLQKVFFAGDSSGANIANNMAIRFGLNPIPAIHLEGLILIHPFFGGKDPIGSECEKHKQLKEFTDQFWMLANPSASMGVDDPMFNPAKDPNLSGLGCSRILVVVAEKDHLKDRGLYYSEVMGKNGWGGSLELMESKGEEHAFFFFTPLSENSCTMRKKISTFINHIHTKP